MPNRKYIKSAQEIITQKGKCIGLKCMECFYHTPEYKNVCTVYKKNTNANVLKDANKFLESQSFCNDCLRKNGCSDTHNFINNNVIESNYSTCFRFLHKNTPDLSNVKTEKLPAGITPRPIYDETRLNAINYAIERYNKANKLYPKEWLEERDEIVSRMRERQKKEKPNISLSKEQERVNRIDEILKYCDEVASIVPQYLKDERADLIKKINESATNKRTIEKLKEQLQELIKLTYTKQRNLLPEHYFPWAAPLVSSSFGCGLETLWQEKQRLLEDEISETVAKIINGNILSNWFTPLRLPDSTLTQIYFESKKALIPKKMKQTLFTSINAIHTGALQDGKPGYTLHTLHKMICEIIIQNYE